MRKNCTSSTPDPKTGPLKKPAMGEIFTQIVGVKSGVSFFLAKNPRILLWEGTEAQPGAFPDGDTVPGRVFYHRRPRKYVPGCHPLTKFSPSGLPIAIPACVHN